MRENHFSKPSMALDYRRLYDSRVTALVPRNGDLLSPITIPMRLPSHFPSIHVGDKQTKLKMKKTSNSGTCSICLDEDATTTTFCCSQYMHGKCLREWVRLNPTCPLCRGTDSIVVVKQPQRREDFHYIPSLNSISMQRWWFQSPGMLSIRHAN